MKRKTFFIIGLILSAAFVLAAVQPALAAERTVKLRIPACGWPDSERQVSITGQQIKGVTRVVASYISGTATITFDDTVVTVEEIVEHYNRANLRVMGKPQMIQ